MSEENIKKQKTVLSAVTQQDIQLLRQCVQDFKRGDFRFTDKSGNTILHLASKTQSGKTLEVMQILLNGACDAEAVNEFFETPLDIAIKHNNPPAISAIKQGLLIKQQRISRYIQDAIDAETVPLTAQSHN